MDNSAGIILSLNPQVKKTWLAPEDTVFARVSIAEKPQRRRLPSCTYALAMDGRVSL